MKKHIYVLAFALAIIMSPAGNVVFAGGSVSADSANATAAAQLQQMQDRLQQIKAMDKLALGPAQRAQLRSELKAMRASYRYQRDRQRHNIYLAVFIGLIVVLALILFL